MVFPLFSQELGTWASTELQTHGFTSGAGDAEDGDFMGISGGFTRLFWLVVWNIFYIFFHTLGMSSSQLTNIFQRG